jgi:hypothetical protein
VNLGDTLKTNNDFIAFKINICDIFKRECDVPSCLIVKPEVVKLGPAAIAS